MAEYKKQIILFIRVFLLFWKRVENTRETTWEARQGNIFFLWKITEIEFIVWISVAKKGRKKLHYELFLSWSEKMRVEMKRKYNRKLILLSYYIFNQAPWEIRNRVTIFFLNIKNQNEITSFIIIQMVIRWWGSLWKQQKKREKKIPSEKKFHSSSLSDDEAVQQGKNEMNEWVYSSQQVIKWLWRNLFQDAQERKQGKKFLQTFRIWQ
jgi:hypothetical protein